MNFRLLTKTKNKIFDILKISCIYVKYKINMIIVPICNYFEIRYLRNHQSLHYSIYIIAAFIIKIINNKYNF